MRRFSLPELRRLGGERWTASATPVLAQLPTIPTFQELRPALDGELRRSRRYERPLAVLVVVPDLESSSNGNGSPTRGGSSARHSGGAHSAIGSGNSPAPTGAESSQAPNDEMGELAMRPLYWAQMRFLLLGSLLCGTFRESDIVSYAAELHEFVAFLPECGGTAAHQAVERVDRLYLSRIGVGLRAGLAVYPTDGLTLDDLLEHARLALAQTPIRRTLVNQNGNGAAHE